MLPNAWIGRRSRIRRAIIAQDACVPENSEIGYDLDADRLAGYLVTETGIVVVHGDSAGRGVSDERHSADYAPAAG